MNIFNFNRELHDLGEKMHNALFSGIYSPIYPEALVKSYMSAHYEQLEEAIEQSKRFNLNDYYNAHLKRNLGRIKSINKNSQLKILDICCGFGSTTIPLLELFPNSLVIASELSLSMLYVLKSKLNNTPQKNRCEILQLNAEDLDFKEETFDIICGAASLHHLFDPEITFKQMYKIMKMGGVGIFFEPFENGMAIIGLAYMQIINDSRFNDMPPNYQTYFKGCLSTWQKMKNKDKSDPFFQGVDDKWLFTQSYFQDIAERLDYSKCIISTLNKSQTPFYNLFKVHSTGNNIKDIPQWVHDIVRTYDDYFSDDAKCDFMTEGCIIFVK